MDQSLQQITKPLSRLLQEYHLTIVVVVVAIVVGAAIFQLYQIVVISTSTGVDGYAPTSKANAQFDQSTIDAITELKSVSESDQPLKFPTRPSPFVE